MGSMQCSVDNHTEHTDTPRTSQETHYVSATETNRLMVFRKQSLFIVRTIRNTQINCVNRKQTSSVPKQVVQIITTVLCKDNYIKMFKDVGKGELLKKKVIFFTTTLVNSFKPVSCFAYFLF
jgi:hypothetical protein